MWVHTRVWNLLSATAIGVSYFIIGSTNRADTQYGEHLYDISIIWLSTGIVGLLAFVQIWFSIGHLTVAGHALDVHFPDIPSANERHDEEARTIYFPPAMSMGADGFGHVKGAPGELQTYPLEAGHTNHDSIDEGDEGDTSPPPNRLFELWFSPRLLYVRKILMYTCTAFGGVLICLSQACLKIAFGADYVDWGPLTSVTCADVIIVTLFFYAVLGHTVSRWEAVSMGLIATGIGIALLVDVKDALPVEAVSFSLMAAVCLAGSVILIRHTILSGISPLTGFVVRMIVQGVLGVILLLYLLLTVPNLFTRKTSLYDFILPALAGCSQAVAVLSVNKAMTGPPSDSPPTILSLSPVVVLVLAYLFYGVLPHGGLALSMGVIFVGCVFPTVVRGVDEWRRGRASSEVSASLLEPPERTMPIMPPPPPHLMSQPVVDPRHFVNTTQSPSARSGEASPLQPDSAVEFGGAGGAGGGDLDAMPETRNGRMILSQQVSGLDIFRVMK